ncbi:conserved hypothetical protein [Mucor ambiguus]|uniref:F-box domain-containing protein n=1 Tax=Mucor ambiguus TaxID=91626 RepID=A0A0C9MIG7_9FUNG|nr:conserved hypothetical protein [Mucor ambiguus]
MPKPPAEPSSKKVCRSKNLELIKAKLGNALNAYERRELIKFLEQIGTCDIIEKLPFSILSLVCEYFTPHELCQLRLVSKEWDKKITHDCIWKPICQDYGILAATHTSTATAMADATVSNQESSSSSTLSFFNTFKRSLTTSRNWKIFQSKRYELHLSKGPILSLLVADVTRVFSGDLDGSIHVWNAQSNEYVTTLKAHTKHVACLAHHQDVLASGSSDMTIAIHNMYSFEKLHILRGHVGPVTSLVFTSKATQNEALLISGSTDRTIRIWDTKKETCLRILHGQENTIISLAFSASIPHEYCQSEADASSVRSNKAGYIISGSSDRNVFVWDLKKSILDDSPQVINSIMGTNGPVTAMAVYDESAHNTPTPAGTTIANSPYLLARQPIHIPPFIIYASMSDATISLYSIPGLEKTYIEAPNIHRGTIWSITAVPLHSKLITTSGDRTAMIWDLKSPKKCTTLGGFDSTVVSSAVSPQEEILCFGTEKGTLIVFDLQEFH